MDAITLAPLAVLAAALVLGSGAAAAQIAPQRTLEELKAEAQARADRNAYPLIGRRDVFPGAAGACAHQPGISLRLRRRRHVDLSRRHDAGPAARGARQASLKTQTIAAVFIEHLAAEFPKAVEM